MKKSVPVVTRKISTAAIKFSVRGLDDNYVFAGEGRGGPGAGPLVRGTVAFFLSKCLAAITTDAHRTVYSPNSDLCIHVFFIKSPCGSVRYR